MNMHEMILSKHINECVCYVNYPTRYACCCKMFYMFWRCTVDPNAVFISQSLSEIRFAFQYFEYAMSKGFTKLHCNAISCSPESSSACQTNCENQGEDQGHRPPA